MDTQEGRKVWEATVGKILSVCVADVKKAPESLIGRAAARVLLSLAFSSGSMLKGILRAFVPFAESLFQNSPADSVSVQKQAMLDLLAALSGCISSEVVFVEAVTEDDSQVVGKRVTMADVLQSLHTMMLFELALHAGERDVARIRLAWPLFNALRIS